MTLSSTTNRISHTGDGLTVIFAYTFKIFAKTDLLVYDAGELQTVDVDYTVSGMGEEDGGNVTFVAAPADGNLVEIIREMPLKQLTDYIEGGKFPSESHEYGLDKIVMMVQRAFGKMEASPIVVFTAADATPSVLGGRVFATGGADTYTDFDDGVTGKIIVILAEHAATITHGTNIFLNGDASRTMTVGDTAQFICKGDNKWYEIPRTQ